MTIAEKIPAVCSWLGSRHFRRLIFDEHRKVLMFGHHLDMLREVSSWLAEREIGHVLITGEVPSAVRTSEFSRFTKDPDCKVAVLGIEVAGQGLNLVAASLVVFLELRWVPGHHEQAEERAWRIGQKRDVVIIYLPAKGSVDDIMWSTIERKIGLIESVQQGSSTGLQRWGAA